MGDLSTLGVHRGALPAELRTAPGMRKLDWVLGLEDPRGYVSSLATTELYYLMKDIGTSDVSSLLEMASDEQVQGLMDLDLWTGYEVRLERWLGWIDLAKEAGLEAALRVIRVTEPEVIQLFFTGEIQVLPKDVELDEVPDVLQITPTPDGEFFVTIPVEHPIAPYLHDFMKLLWAADIEKMRDILVTARFELPSQVEETLIHFRRGRLEEMGLAPPEEALGVYAWLDPERVRERVRTELEGLDRFYARPLGESAGDLALRGAHIEGLLREALSQLDEDGRERFAQALSYLVQKVFMARTGDLSRTDALPEVGTHTAALISLGLGYVSGESLEQAVAVVERLWPEELFRVGYTLTVQVGRLAHRIAPRAGVPQGLRLFGDPTDDALEAAVRLRPQYFEGLTPGASEVAFRDFRSLGELERTRALLEDADAYLRFFERSLGFTPRALSEALLEGLGEDDRAHIRFGTLLRTGLAQLLLSDQLSFEPLERDELAAFLEAAFEGAELRPAMRELLGTLTSEVPEPVQRVVQGELAELGRALVDVESADLDPRFLAGLVLVRGGEA